MKTESNRRRGVGGREREGGEGEREREREGERERAQQVDCSGRWNLTFTHD